MTHLSLKNLSSQPPESGPLWLEHSFLVCALPSKLLQGLAHILSVPGQSYCEFGGTLRAASVAEFWENAQNSCQRTQSRIYGNCDPSNLLILPSLLGARPLTRAILVKTPVKQVQAELEAAGVPLSPRELFGFETLAERYARYFDLVVEAAELDRSEGMALLFEQCLPDVPPERVLACLAQSKAWARAPGPVDDSKYLALVSNELLRKETD